MHEKVTAAATYGGSALAFFGGLSANEVAAYGGLIIATLGWATGTAISVWYKLQLLRIARAKGFRVNSDE